MHEGTPVPVYDHVGADVHDPKRTLSAQILFPRVY